jgi:hypothetical protein
MIVAASGACAAEIAVPERTMYDFSVAISAMVSPRYS